MDNYSATSAAQRRSDSVSDSRSKASDVDRWVDLPERGTPASLQLMAWIAVHLGRAITRLLLFPITLYFVIASREARQTSYEFLKRARGRSVHWWHVFRHFYCFAATILDRLYFFRVVFERFRVTIHGRRSEERRVGKECRTQWSGTEEKE